LGWRWCHFLMWVCLYSHSYLSLGYFSSRFSQQVVLESIVCSGNRLRWVQFDPCIEYRPNRDFRQALPPRCFLPQDFLKKYICQLNKSLIQCVIMKRIYNSIYIHLWMLDIIQLILYIKIEKIQYYNYNEKNLNNAYSTRVRSWTTMNTRQRYIHTITFYIEKLSSLHSLFFLWERERFC